MLIAQLTKIASDHSCALISGASPAGNQIAGALTYASHGHLRPWTPTESGNVLAVDGVVAGLSGLQSHMALLRRITTGHIHGVAIASRHLGDTSSDDIDVLPTPLMTSVA